MALHGTAFAESESRLSDEVTPFSVDTLPARPAPILELGEPFFDTGEIGSGFELPTGAVWRPSLIVWGTNRTAFQRFDDGRDEVVEWAERFDFFSNLYLSSTERIVFGARPFDRSGRFTRYTFVAPEGEEDEEDSFEDELNFDVRTLFFEGDFGELFPLFDPLDSRSLDMGIAVGRQPLSFQDGILLNDSVDSLGLSRINIKPSWAVNHRAAFVWGWGELNRSNRARDDDGANLFGVFNEIDWRASTVELDFAYVDADDSGNGFFGGLGATQRIAGFNTTLRLLGSLAEDEETIDTSDGGLLFFELSQTLAASHDFVYLSGFWALEQYRSASRDPSVGGPLAAAGILFESAGLGRYASPLDSGADEVFGGALGHQLFFLDNRLQLVLEAAGRYATEDIGERAAAIGGRLQAAVGRRSVIRLDLFGSYGSQRETPEDDEEAFGNGCRLEWLLQL